MLLLLVLLFLDSVASVPQNDRCSGALLVRDGVTLSSNLNASAQTDCVLADIYFYYTATCSGNIFVRASTLRASNLVGVRFAGTDCTQAADDCVYSPLTLEYPVSRGQLIYFAIGDETYRGEINVTVQCLVAPSNDICSGAMPILNGVAQADNSAAISHTSCINEGDIFFRYAPTCTGSALVTFTAANDSYLTAFGFVGASCADLNEESCTSLAISEFAVSVGQDLFLAVGSFSLISPVYRGVINVSVECISITASDTCSTALTIYDGITKTSNHNATSQTTCIPYADVFFRYRATCTGYARAQFAAFSGESMVATYFLGSLCGALEQEASCVSGGSQTNLYFPVTTNQDYVLAAGSGNFNLQGLFTVDLRCDPPPENDKSAGALNVTDGLTRLNNFGASKDVSCISAADIYVSYKATCSGTLTAEFKVSVLESILARFIDGSPKCTSRGSSARFEFSVIQGISYVFAVGSGVDYRGEINFTASCIPHDKCEDALVVSDGLSILNNTGAVKDVFCTRFEADVFLAYNATCTGTVIATFGVIPASNYLVAAQFASGTCNLSAACFFGYTTFALYQQVERLSTYYFAVGSRDMFRGSLTASMECYPVPVNDECEGALNLSTSGGSFNNAGATRSNTRCIPEADLFFRYLATCTGLAQLTFVTRNASSDLKAVWFSGETCSKIGSETDCTITGGNRPLTFSVQLNRSYYIAVGSQSGYRGSIDIHTSCFVTAPTFPPTRFPTRFPTTPPTRQPPAGSGAADDKGLIILGVVGFLTVLVLVIAVPRCWESHQRELQRFRAAAAAAASQDPTPPAVPLTVLPPATVTLASEVSCQQNSFETVAPPIMNYPLYSEQMQYSANPYPYSHPPSFVSSSYASQPAYPDNYSSAAPNMQFGQPLPFYPSQPPAYNSPAYESGPPKYDPSYS